MWYNDGITKRRGIFVYIQKKKKLKISRKSLFFLIGIFLVLVVLITGIVMFSTRGREVEDTLIDLPFSADSPHFAVGNTIVYASSEYLTCMDAAQNTKWQFNLFSGDLAFEASKDNIAAYGASVIHVIDANGGYLFSKQIDAIQSVRVGADKVAVYATQQSKDETLSYIVIFDLAGESLYKVDITDKHVLDYGFDSDSQDLYILELDVSGAAPISTIWTYREETQSTTGFRTTGFKEMKDQLIERVFIYNHVVYASGTNRLTMYASPTDEEQRILIYGWILEDIRLSSPPEFVYVPSGGEYHDIARIIDVDGNETVINLPPRVFSLIHNGDKIYCFASQNIFVYTSDGNYLRTYDLPFEIDGMQKAMPGFVFVTKDGAVYLMPLP
jgi:hypothetical protein